MTAHVSVVGHFEGDRVPSDRQQWLSDTIKHTIRQAAASWTGTVLDLPGKKDEWARYVTAVVAPTVARPLAGLVADRRRRRRGPWGPRRAWWEGRREWRCRWRRGWAPSAAHGAEDWYIRVVR